VDAFAHPASIVALETFRLNGALIALGDAVVAPLGLTSARWQVMGAIAEANGGLPVSGLARNMGLVRQSVQRLADELTAAGLVTFAPNPHHRRAKLVQLTRRGSELFDEANALWLPIADALLAGMDPGAAERGAEFVHAFRMRIEAVRASDPHASMPG
jgi:DNA-binding MarR family transcriptional regulator